MPPPNRRHDPSPEELARQVAARLARSKPTTARFSLRNSVLVGRLIAGVTMLVSIAVVVAGVVAGASWMLARTTEPEVLAKTVTPDDAEGSVGITPTTELDGTFAPLVPLMFPSSFADSGGPANGSGTTSVTIPAATTTTTSTTSTSTSVTSSTSMPITTTIQVTTTTVQETTTTVQETTTSSSSVTTAPPPSTTTTVPEPTTTMPSTTTTTKPTTTTTVATTTTTEATTTTTRPSPPSTPGQGG